MTVIVVASRSDVRQETSRAFGLLKFQRTLRRRSDDARGDALAPAAGRASPDGGFAARAARAAEGSFARRAFPRAPLARLVFRGVLVGRRAVGGTSVGGSREWGSALSGRPPSDAELAAAEERADALKERFALATDPGEQEELLELATEATLLVNTMRAERAFTPAHARAAADEARRALAPERKMLAELLEDASSRREERDARASHALVDVVRARSPSARAPAGPVDERVPPARASPTGDAVLRARPPRRRAATPPPRSERPRGPRASPGNPGGRLRRHARDRSPEPRVANRRRARPPARRRSTRAPSPPRAIGAAAIRRRRGSSARPRIIRAKRPRNNRRTPPSRNPPSRNPPSPRRRLRRGGPPSRATARAKTPSASSVERGGDSTAAHAARPRGARESRPSPSGRARGPRRRASIGDGRGRERRRGEGAARALDAAGLAADRVAGGVGRGEFSAGGLPMRGTRNDGVHPRAGDPPTRGLPRRGIERATNPPPRAAATASSASGGGGGGGVVAASPLRARGGGRGR